MVYPLEEVARGDKVKPLESGAAALTAPLLTGKTYAQSEAAISILPARTRAIRGNPANVVTHRVPSPTPPQLTAGAALSLASPSKGGANAWRNVRTIWIADAHRGDGKRFVVRADEKLTAFLELESAGEP